MPRPSTVPSWATDATSPAGGDPWSGEPTRIEPDAGEKAAGFTPETEPPAEWFNWAIGFGFDWITHFAALTNPLTARTLEIGPAGAGAGIENWTEEDDVAQVRLESQADAVYLYFPINLPNGSQITGVEAIVDPG